MNSTWEKFPANTNTNTIRFEKITWIRIWIIFGLKKIDRIQIQNTIQFERITQIQIRILVFGLNYSNNIRILNHLLTSVTIRISHHHYHLYHCHHKRIGKLSNFNIIFFLSAINLHIYLLYPHIALACVLHCVVHCDQDVSLNIDVELTFIHEHERTLPKAIAPVHQVLIHFSRFDGELTIVSTDGGGGASTHWWSSIDHSYLIVGNSACLIECQKWVGRYL